MKKVIVALALSAVAFGASAAQLITKEEVKHFKLTKVGPISVGPSGGEFSSPSDLHDQQLFFDVVDEFENAEAVGAGDAAQHHHHEQDTGDIEAHDQLAELHQGANAVFTDGKRHGAKGPQRRQAHDQDRKSVV